MRFLKAIVKGSVCALALLVGVQGYNFFFPSLPEVIEETNKSTVAIGCPIKNGYAVTAGFVSAKGYIITVAHGLVNCIGPRQVGIKVRFYDTPGIYSAQIVRFNRTVDVAILRIKNMPPVRPLVIETEAPPAGTPIVAIGHPQLLFWSSSYGIVAADRWLFLPYLHYIQISCPINEGNSGGPIIDMRGRVIGIGDMYIDNPTLGLAVAGDFLKLMTRGVY